MVTTRITSFERSGFAAMAALTLAPLIFQALWPLIAASIGVAADSYSLTLAALAVAGAAAIAHGLLRQRARLRSMLLASATGIGIALMLGNDARSALVLALALAALAVGAALLIAWLVAHLPLDLDGLARRHRIQMGLYILLAIYTIGQTARLSTFMGDATRIEQSIAPSVIFLVDHSCLTAYVHALQLARAGEANLYDVSRWPDEVAQGAVRGLELSKTAPYTPFYLDGYMYPPQFLLLPAALFSVSDTFLVQRALWFGLSGIFLAVGFWIVAQWVGEKNRRHALLLMPLLWSSLVILVTLQVGNVHHVVIVMALLAMLAFEHKKPALGGALLAFAIVSKLSPALLVVILLAQRRWRAAAWTCAFGALFTLASIIAFGTQPIASFVAYQLPRLSSGEAMRWFSSAVANVSINSSPFGIPFKLSALGVPFNDLWGTARIINTCYTLVILGVTVMAARQRRDRQQTLHLCLAVLTLSALQSPFAPGYVIMPVIWILSLLVATVQSRAGLIALALAWVALSLPPIENETAALIVSLLQQVVVLGIVVVVLLHKPARTQLDASRFADRGAEMPAEARPLPAGSPTTANS